MSSADLTDVRSSALAAGEVDVSGMIGARLPLAQGPAALRAAARGDMLKVLIEVGR